MAARPRVLGVIASSVPGGAESVFSMLLRGLSGRFDPFVVCDSTGAMVGRYRALSVDLVSTPMNAPGHVGATRVIADAIERWSIDLVHTHLWNADLFGGMAAAWCGVPSVSTVHGSNFLPFGVTGLHRFRRNTLSLVYRSVYRLCDRVLAPSQALLTDLAERPGIRVPPNLVTVVHNGIDLEEINRRSAAAQLPDIVAQRMSAPLVACVANMFAIKGQDWLIRALPAIRAAVPEAVLVLVGDGESRPSLEQLVRETGVSDRVIFTGSIENPLAILERAEVVVLPSLSEGLPIALLEAMAIGRAVVASNVGGIPEVVKDGETGLLIPPADAQALSAAIVRLLQDAPLRTSLGERARAHVARHWSSQRMVDCTAAVYDEVLAARKAGKAGVSRPAGESNGRPT
jgi:glycosyltransferase involved in cell wall biosynthesis